MRAIIFLLLLLSLAAKCQARVAKTKTPKTLEETFLYLDKVFDDTSKYSFMMFPRSTAAIMQHFGLGMWIRNNWGLWNHGYLYQYFKNQGLNNPDDISHIILLSYHCYLNHEPINIELLQGNIYGIVEDSILIKSFETEDTVLISASGIYKSFLRKGEHTTVNATAVIKEKRSERLLLEYIHIPVKKGVVFTDVVGDTSSRRPIDCTLLPPRGWKWK